MSREEPTAGAVQDFALGAVVNGEQTTRTAVSIAPLPSLQGAQFDVVVDGIVNSATVASTPQANIHQQGQVPFRATKRVLMDGNVILTQQTIVQVAPQQTVVGAQTRPMAIPLFNNMADRIAYRAAMNRLPQSNLIAGQKVISRVQPEIDQKIDAQLSAANEAIRNQLWTLLKEWNVQPEHKAAFSSAERLHWDYRLAEQPLTWIPPVTSEPVPIQEHIPGAALPLSLNGGDLEIHLHDSLFETIARRRQLGGKTISLNDLRDATDRLLLLVAQEIPAKSNNLPLAINFTFDPDRPLRGEFKNNALTLFLRGTFQAGNLPRTEPQQLKIRLVAEIINDEVNLKATDVEVREIAVDGTLQSPGITQSAIASQLKTHLVPIQLKRDVLLPGQLAQSLKLTLQTPLAANNWASIPLQARPLTGHELHFQPNEPVPINTFSPTPYSPSPVSPTPIIPTPNLNAPNLNSPPILEPEPDPNLPSAPSFGPAFPAPN